METLIVNGSDKLPLVANGYNSLGMPAYWRMINFLADNMASFPIYVALNGFPVKESSPLDPFFKLRANPQQSAHQFWRTWHFHASHTGNGYGLIRRPSSGSSAIMGLHNLLPENVTIYRIVFEGDSILDCQIYYYDLETQTSYPAADILHKCGLGYDGLVGYSPYSLHAPTFGRAALIDRYSMKVLAKGSSVKATIEFPDGSTKKIVEEVLETTKQYRAATGDRDIMALWGGATMKQQGISPADAQILEQDREMTKKMAQITGVDPRFAFEKSEGKYTDNAVAAGQDVVRFTFRTAIEQTEAELTIKLLTPSQLAANYTIRLNADALLRGDLQTQMAVASILANQGIGNTNEARELVNLPPDPNPKSNEIRDPTHLSTSVTPAAGDKTNDSAK